MKRGEYWTAMIIHWLILLVPLYPMVRFLVDSSYTMPDYYLPWVLPLWCFYLLLTIIPVWSATVRRLHTLPRKGWWLLIGFVPVIGWFIILIWLLQKGNYEEIIRRLKRAAAANNLPGSLSAALGAVERPRNGGWFFVCFLLLAAGGWFLNRQVVRTGFSNTAMAALQDVSANGFAAIRDKELAAIQKAKAAEKPSSPQEQPMTGVTVITTQETAVTVTADIIEEIAAEPIEDAVEEILPTLDTAADGHMGKNTVSLVSKKNDELKPDEGVSDEEPAGSVETEEPTETPAETIHAEPGQPVIAKQDGSILLLTENDVLASVYAVTVEQYKQCAEADACDMPEALFELAYAGLDDDADKLPMVYVTNEQAAAYCEWAGMRLPSAAEWKAAAGYSGSVEFTPANVNAVGTNRRAYIHSEDQQALTVPVTVFRTGASDYGMVQMAGNVWEWTAPDADPAVSYAMGGAWNSYLSAVGPDAQMEAFSGYAADNVGFRCFADMSSLDPADFEVSETDVEVLLNPGLWAEKGVRAKDNAPMVYIPAATFSMGVANSSIDEKPVHDVTLSAYWIDAYEVTNEKYALCVADGVCTEPHETKSFRQPSYYGNPAFNHYPVIAVDHEQAETYCEWAETRLPTEAEWEYAVKGEEGNTYPWGSAFVAANLNYSGNGNYDTLAVNANPDDVSSFGVYDLGGNVSEWVLDRYQENWYSVTDQPVDPIGPENGSYYVIRGGSAQTAENNVRAADRFYGIGTSFSLDRGFRCAVKDEQ